MCVLQHSLKHRKFGKNPIVHWYNTPIVVYSYNRWSNGENKLNRYIHISLEDCNYIMLSKKRTNCWINSVYNLCKFCNALKINKSHSVYYRWKHLYVWTDSGYNSASYHLLWPWANYLIIPL